MRAEVGKEIAIVCSNRGMAMLNLEEIAVRLDNEERLRLRYRSPVAADGEAEWIVRDDRLLDVAEDQGILFVEKDGEPVWVKLEEAIEVLLDIANSEAAGC